MPAQSQQQQKLFGLALAFKRGEVPASEVSDEIKDIADRMSEKEIEDFASTKHKGLPKMKEQLRKIVREIMRERVITELEESYKGNMSDFKYEFPNTFENETGNSSKAIKKISKKGKGYEVRTSIYMSEPEMKKVGDAMGLKLVNYQKSSNIAVTLYESQLPNAMIPSNIKVKLNMAIDKIKDTNLTYNQKLQVIGKIINSLGIDKKELVKMSTRLKGTLESVNEAYVVLYAKKKGEKPASAAFQLRGSALSFEKDLKKDGYITMMTQKKVKGVDESVNEEKVYIDFLNKKKGFKQDRIKFNSYEDAVKWAKKNFEKFNPDMIKYESVNEGASTEEKRIVMMAIKKIAKYRNVPLNVAVVDTIRAAEELERTIKK